MTAKSRFGYLLFICFSLSSSAIAKEHDYDKYNGDDINQVCAGCHGEYGMGGKEGKYPRLSGMSVKYLFKEMIAFRDRKRPNMAMVEHVDDRQMPESDIMDIAIFLNKIKLATKMSDIDEKSPDFDAYARLLEAKQTIQIPKAKGDIKAGKKLYKRECRSCHAKDGMGDDDVPQLAGQYTEYLVRQIKLYIDLKRHHDEDDPEEEFFKSFSTEQMRDIFAYISVLDD
ncbi:MAG: c-type cytochrome [Thiotrichaceae bacterium]|nr:c-type cytochrome [Thiotrichaceae bacterium]